MDLPGQAGERGYAMAALLVSIAVMSVLLSMAIPVWRHQAQREKEAELIFRGEQYARAIALFQRRTAGAFPPSIDLLVEQKFLRKKYKDPMTEDGEFQILYQASLARTPQSGSSTTATPQPGGSPAGPTTERADPPPGLQSQFQASAGPRGGIVGVASKSKEQSIRIYNGRTRYNEWQFVFSALTQQPSAPPAAQPGLPPGVQPGMRPGSGQNRRPGANPGGFQRSFPDPEQAPRLPGAPR